MIETIIDRCLFFVARCVTLLKETPMQFLYRLTPVRIEMVTVGPTPEEQAIVSEHFAHLEALTAQGVILLVGRTQDDSPRTFGIVIFQAESDEQAHEIMNGNPAVRKGIMRAELFPFRIALAGDLPGV
jgi:uncharacterized protein YciI